MRKLKCEERVSCKKKITTIIKNIPSAAVRMNENIPCLVRVMYCHPTIRTPVCGPLIKLDESEWTQLQ